MEYSYAFLKIYLTFGVFVFYLAIELKFYRNLVLLI